MKLPPRLLDPVLRFLIWMSVGRPEAYGLPKPVAKSLNDQRPVVNSLVLHWIQHGRIVPAPGLRQFDGHDVEFVDGTRQAVDTIVWATGFRAALPFLSEDLIRREAGIPLRVAGCILPAGGPARLYFVGLCAPRGPQLPVYSAQSEVIMDMLDQQEQMDRPLVDTFSARTGPSDGSTSCGRTGTGRWSGPGAAARSLRATIAADGAARQPGGRNGSAGAAR